MPDFSSFRQTYKDPIQDEAAVRGYEAGRGARASELDQFYTSLDQQETQFSRSLAFEGEKLESSEEQFYTSLDQQETQFSRSLAFEGEKLESSEEQFSRSLAFEEEKLASTEKLFGEELAFKGEQLAFQERESEQQLALGREQLASEDTRWRDELEQLRIWQNRQLGEAAADRTSRETMFNQELNFNQGNLDRNYALEAKKFNLDAAINAPITKIGEGRYGQDILGRNASPWQITDTALGVRPSGTQELYGSETQGSRETSMFNKYLSAGGY